MTTNEPPLSPTEWGTIQGPDESPLPTTPQEWAAIGTPSPQPQGPQGRPDWWDENLERERGIRAEKRDRDFMLHMQEQVKKNPDLEAMVQEFEVDLGIERDVLRSNLDEAKALHQQWQLRNLDIAKQFPSMHRAMMDPDFAAIAHDDFARLGFLEKIDVGFRSGLTMVELGELSQKQMAYGGRLSEREEERIRALRAELDDYGHVGGWVGGGAQVVGQMWNVETAGALALGAVASVASGGVAIGLLAGGAAWIGAQQAYEVEGGLAYNQYRYDLGLSHDVAASHAHVVGMVNSVVEVASLGTAVGRVLGPISRNVARRAIGTSPSRGWMRRLMTDALTKQSAQRSIRRASARFAEQWGTNIGEEVIQESVTALGEYFAAQEQAGDIKTTIGDELGSWTTTMPGGGEVSKLADGSLRVTPDIAYLLYGQKLDPSVDVLTIAAGPDAESALRTLGAAVQFDTTLQDGRVMSGLADVAAATAVEAAQSMAFISAIGPTGLYLSESRRARAVEERHKRYEETAKATEGSKTGERSTDKFQQFMAATWGQSELREVHISREGMQKALDDAGLTIDDLDAVLPGAAEQMRKPVEEQPKLVFSGAEFFARLRGMNLVEQLTGDIAPDAMTFSANEKAERIEELQTLAQEAGRFTDENLTAQEAVDNDVEAIEKRLVEENRAAGVPFLRARANAQIEATVLRRKAEEASIARGELVTPSQLIEEMGGKARVLTPEAAEAASQAERFEQFIGEIGAERLNELPSLARAREMAGEGASGQQIRAETGWHIGPDGMPRLEVPTREADVVLSPGDIRQSQIERSNRSPTEPDPGLATLGDVMDFPRLFEAYPELRGIRVLISDSRAMNGAAGIARQDGTLEFAHNLSDAEFRSALLHEIQHVIQTTEGFAAGSSPWFFTEERVQQITRQSIEGRLREMQDEGVAPEVIEQVRERFALPMLEALGQEDPNLDGARELWEDLFVRQTFSGVSEEQQSLMAGAAAVPEVRSRELYEDTAGEIEAREVQERDVMTDEERSRIHPRDQERHAERLVLTARPDGALVLAEDQTAVPIDSTEGFSRQKAGDESLQARSEEGTTKAEFDPKTLDIILHQEHDASSFLHELGHLSVEVDLQMILSGTASDEQIQNVETLIDQLGFRDQFATAEDLALSTLDERRTFHEAVARSFEGYMFDGKAPTRELQAVFRRMADWVIAVYQGIRERIDRDYHAQTGEHLAAMTPEVRMVFDRWLASQREMQASAQGLALGRLLMGEDLTPEEQELIDSLIFDLEHEAQEKLRNLHRDELLKLRPMRARIYADLQKQGRRERAQREREEREELLRTNPIARIAQWLATGDLHDADGNIDREAQLKRHRGKRRLWLPDGDDRVPDRYQTKNQESALEQNVEGLALSQGFASADDMFDQLAEFLAGKDNAEAALDELVAQRTDERMLAEVPHLIDEETMQIEVDTAIANEAMLTLRAAELSILDKRPDAYRDLVQVAKETARDIVSGLRLADLTGHGNAVRRYTLAAERAEKEAIRQRGDVAAMRQAQRTALLQRALAKEAATQREWFEAQIDDLEQDLRFRPRAEKRETTLASRYGGAAVETARLILDRLGIVVGSGVRQDTDWTPTQILPEGDAERVELERDLADATAMLQQFGMLNQQTVEQARNSILGVLGLLGRASAARKFDAFGRKITAEEVANEQEQLADDEKAPQKPQKPSTDRWWGGLQGLIRWRSGTQRLGQQLFAMDGDRVGTLYSLIYLQIREAETQFELGNAEVARQMLELLQPLADQVQKDPKATKPITSDRGADGRPLLVDRNGKAWVFDNGKKDIIGMLLHLGSQSNAERLALGFEWTERQMGGHVDLSMVWDQVEQWEADGIVTEADWKLVQAIWDIYDEHLLPQVQQAHYAVVGREMGVLEKGGPEMQRRGLKGGYVPAARRRETMTAQGRAHAQDSVLDTMRTFPTPARGFTKSRVDTQRVDPLDLDPLRQMEHFRTTLLFVHMAPPVRKVNALLRTPAIEEALERRAPGIYKNIIEPWLATAPTLSRTLPDAKGGDVVDGLGGILGKVRGNFGMSAMLNNFLNSLDGLAGAILATVRTPVSWLVSGSLPSSVDFDLYEASPFMRERHSLHGMSAFELQRDIESMIDARTGLMRGIRWTKRFLAKHTYWMQQLIQKPLDNIVWRGTYLRARAAEEVGGLGQDHAQAVRTADEAVGATQADMAVTAMARHEKGGPLQKLFHQFFSWFIAFGSLSASPTRGAIQNYRTRIAEGASRPAALAEAALRFLVSGVTIRQFATLAFGGLLRVAMDRLAGKDEEEKEQRSFAANWVLDPMIDAGFTMPRALGPVGAAGAALASMASGIEYQVARMPSIPTVSTLERTAARIGKLYSDEEGPSRSDTADIIELLSTLAGIPVQSITKRLRRGFNVFGEERYEDEARPVRAITGR